MPYVCVTTEAGTVHKPLPKHRENPPEPRTQVRNFNLQRALLREAQQTAKLSCRRGALARLGGTARQSPDKEHCGSGGRHGPSLVRSFSCSPCHCWAWLLQTSQIQPGKKEAHSLSEAEGGGTILGKIHTHLSNQHFLELRKDCWQN